MNRKLLRQTATEWRINLWLALELLIVSVVTWYIADYLYMTWHTTSKPMGYATDNCFRVKVGMLTPEAEGYDDSRNNTYAYYSDYQELLDRVRHRDGGEAAAWAMHAVPYTGEKMQNHLIVDTLRISGLARLGTSELPLVLRCRGIRGETPEQLAEIMKRKEAIVTADAFPGVDDPASLIGDTVFFPDFGDVRLRIGAVIEPMRYDRYERNNDASYMFAIGGMMTLDMVVRVSPEHFAGFADAMLDDAEGSMRVGNYYVASVNSLDWIRERYESPNSTKVWSHVTGAVFLLVNIFLGLLGTFWFRTRHRVSEIAIRKVNGATRVDIFRRLLGEGLLILTAVTVVAFGVDVLLAHYQINEPGDTGLYLEWGRVGVCALLTYVVLAMMVTAGIAIPAWRAMKTAPAEVLHDE